MAGTFRSLALGRARGIARLSTRLVDAVRQWCYEITEPGPDSLVIRALGACSLVPHDERQHDISALRRFVDASPGFHAAHSMLATALSENGDRQGAIREMRAASELAPHRVEYRWTLGRLLREDGRPLEAAEELRSIQRPRAWSAAVHLELSLALADLGRDAEAREELQKLLMTAPGYEHTDVVRSLIERLNDADRRHDQI